MDEALAVDGAAPPHRRRRPVDRTAALGGRRRGVGRRGGAPAPDAAQRRRRDRGLPLPALRAHPLPALLRAVPAHLPARPGAVHRRRPPRAGGARRPARRRGHRRGPLRGHARARTARSVVGPAEVAFVVRDDHQSRGLGSILLEHLTAAARERGVRRFEAEVLAAEHPDGAGVPRRGLPGQPRVRRGVLHLEFDIDPTERSMEVRDSREQRAEARSVHNVLHPRSVAVIGASTDPAKIGHAVLLHLLRGNFAGPVYPVNPEARSVRGVRAYPAVTDIPDDVDLAVVAVPAAGDERGHGLLPGQGRQGAASCSARGFADAGPDGVSAQRRLVEEARAHGMRVVGPNALGRREHGSGGPAQRHAGADDARGRPGRASSASPARSASPCSRRPPSAGWACRRSSRPATAPTCRATTCCSTGRPTPPRTSCCSTSSRSATRASSPGWPAGSPAPSRSWR